MSTTWRHGGVAKDTGLQFRDERADEGVFIQSALRHQNFAQYAGERFGHRHGAVQRVLA
ncbi:MAG: hypothetical protein ACTS8S_03215 [Giesbergeria sp.]